MRFSIASASAVVLAAVSLVAAADRCNFLTFEHCLEAAKTKNGGHQLADCRGVIFDLESDATKRCLEGIEALYDDAAIPGECNVCLEALPV